MKRPIQGRYEVIARVGGETARAFIPKPLPPEPPIHWSSDLQSKFDQALLTLGRLDAICDLLPDVSLFLYAYVRKEAVLSSRIEGTCSSLSDLMLYELDEAPGAPLDDVEEVSNYVRALQFGLEKLEELPLSLRLIREIHGILLAKGRGSGQTPGEFRTSQNWIGGTRPGNAHFVPPPPEGIVIRQQSPQWCEARAKLVRAEFTQSIAEHWRSRAIQWNRAPDFDRARWLNPSAVTPQVDACGKVYNLITTSDSPK